jgi:hypothetical protein
LTGGNTDWTQIGIIDEETTNCFVGLLFERFFGCRLEPSYTFDGCKSVTDIDEENNDWMWIVIGVIIGVVIAASIGVFIYTKKKFAVI